MLSFFSKKKVSIQSISIPDLGWPKVKDNEAIIQWINPEETIAVSISYFGLMPDIPTIKNMDLLRAYYRELLAGVGGGLIEVELYKRHQFDIVKTIFKIPQKPSGMTYIGSLTIPFSTCSFVLKVQAVEAGLTGMRETLVANSFLSDVNFDMDAWSADPYDKEYKTGALMNKAEDQQYDSDYPKHPLSQVRNLLNQLEKGFQWESAVEKLSSFNR